MKRTTILLLLLTSLTLAAEGAAAATRKKAAPATSEAKLSASNISGIVKGVARRGPAKPQAGVWVIAETEDLPTKYAKIVITDENGRFLIPDLPKASYLVWARGYGLLDSRKLKTAPGRTIEIRAPLAPNEASAAQYYPAIYWYAMLG